MQELKENNEFKLSDQLISIIKNDFISESLSEKETKNIIKKINDDYNILVDPHTAVGIGVLGKIPNEGINIVLSTAHPCKFPEAVKSASGRFPSFPFGLEKIMEKKENFNILPNNLVTIKKFIKQRI